MRVFGLYALLLTCALTFGQDVTLTLDPGARFTATSAHTLTGTVDPVDAAVTVNGDPVVVDGAGAFSLAVTLSEGLNHFLFYGTRAGLGDGQVKRDIYLDTQAPKLRFLSPEADTVTRAEAVSIYALAYDGYDPAPRVFRDGVELTLDAGRLYEADLPLTEDGPHAFTYTVTDAAGNSADVTLTVVRKTTPPTLTLTAPAVVASGGTYTVTASADPADLPHSLVVTVAGQTVHQGDGSTPYSDTFTQSGPARSLRVSATLSDAAGNETTENLDIEVAHRHFVYGRVLTDADSLPVAGAAVSVTTALATYPLTTDAQGRYAGYVLGLPASVTVAHAGTVPVRRKPLGDGAGLRVADIRLTERAPGQAVGLHDLGTFTVQLSGMAGTAQVTRFSGQGLPVLLPLGYTPVAGFEVFGALGSGTVTVRSDRLPNVGANTLLYLLRANGDAWDVLGAGAAQGRAVDTPVSGGAGVYVLAMRDVWSREAAPVIGARLMRDDDAFLAAASLERATTHPATVSLLDTPSTEVRLTARGDAGLPSGSVARIVCSEVQHVGGVKTRLPDYDLDVVLYRGGVSPEEQNRHIGGSLAVHARATIDPQSTSYAAIRFQADAVPGEPYQFQETDRRLSLGNLVLDFSQAVAADEVVRLIPGDEPPTLGLGSDTVQSFTVEAGAAFQAGLGLTFAGPDYPALILLRELEAGTWVYVGRLSYSDGVWSADADAGGVDRAGSYALVQLDYAATEVRGTVTDTGSPAPDTRITGTHHPWLGVADALGAYRFIIRRGDMAAVLSADHPTTRHAATRTLPDPGQAEQLTGQDLALAPPGFALVAHEPADGTWFVDRTPAISLTFSMPLTTDAALLSAAIQLTGGGDTVALQILPEPDRTEVRLLPRSLLLPDTDYTLSVSTALESLWGNTFSAPAAFTFHTRALTSVGAPDLTRFRLTWDGSQLRVFGPDGALPHLSRLQILDEERAYSWAGTITQGSDVNLPVPGAPGAAFQLRVTAPDGAEASHLLEMTDLGGDTYLMGSSPFRLDFPDGSVLHVDEIESGFGARVTIVPLDAAAATAAMASAPALAPGPAQVGLTGVRFTRADGLPLPHFRGRLAHAPPADAEPRLVQVFHLNENVAVPTSPQDPTPTTTTLADVQHAYTSEAGAVRGKRIGGLYAAPMDVNSPYGAATFAVGTTPYDMYPFRAIVRVFRAGGTSGGDASVVDPLSGVPIFAPVNGSLKVVAISHEGGARCAWYGISGPVVGVDPVTHANVQGTTPTVQTLTDSQGTPIQKQGHLDIAFGALNAAGTDYAPKVALVLEVGTYDAEQVFTKDEAASTALADNHFLEADPDSALVVRLVATALESTDGFEAELIHQGGTAKKGVTGRQDGPNQRIYDLPGLVDSPGHHQFHLYMPNAAEPTGKAVKTLLVGDPGNPGLDMPGPPDVVYWEPADEAKDVAVLPRMYVLFSEPVKLDGAVTLRDDDDSEIDTTLVTADGRVLAAGEAVGEVLIYPAAAFRFDAEYTLTIDGAVDQGGTALAFQGENAPFTTSFSTRKFPKPDPVHSEDAYMTTAAYRNLLVTLRGAFGSGNGVLGGFNLSTFDLRDPDDPKKIYDTGGKRLMGEAYWLYTAALFGNDELRDDDLLLHNPVLNPKPVDGMPVGSILAVGGHQYRTDAKSLFLYKWDGGAWTPAARLPLIQQGTLRTMKKLGAYVFLSFKSLDGGGVTVVYDVRDLLRAFEELEAKKDTLNKGEYNRALRNMPIAATYPLPTQNWDITPFRYHDGETFQPGLLLGGNEHPGMMVFDPDRPLYEPAGDRDGRSLATLEYPSGSWLSKSRIGRVNNYTGAVRRLRYRESGNSTVADFAVFGENDGGGQGQGYVFVWSVPPSQQPVGQVRDPRLILVLENGLKNMAVDELSGLVAIQDLHRRLSVLDLKTALENTTPGQVVVCNFDHPFFLLDKTIAASYRFQMSFHDGWLIGVEHDGNEESVRPIPINPVPYRARGWEYLDLEAALYAHDGRVDTRLRFADSMVLYASDWDLGDGPRFSMEMGSYVVDTFAEEQITLELRTPDGTVLSTDKRARSRGVERQVFAQNALATYFKNSGRQADLRKAGAMRFALFYEVRKSGKPVLRDTVPFVVAYLSPATRYVDPDRRIDLVDALTGTPDLFEVDQAFSTRDSRQSLNVDRYLHGLYAWQETPYGPGVADAAQLQLGMPTFWDLQGFNPAALNEAAARPLYVLDHPGEFQLHVQAAQGASKTGITTLEDDYSGFVVRNDLQSQFGKRGGGYGFHHRFEISYQLEGFKPLDYKALVADFNKNISGKDPHKRAHYPVLRYTSSADVPQALLAGAHVTQTDMPWKNALGFTSKGKPHGYPDTFKEEVRDEGRDRKVMREYTSSVAGVRIASNESDPLKITNTYYYDQDGYLQEVRQNGARPRTYTWEAVPEWTLGSFKAKRLVRVAQGDWFVGYGYRSDLPFKVAELQTPYGTKPVDMEFDAAGRTKRVRVAGAGDAPSQWVSFSTAGEDGTVVDLLSETYGPADGADPAAIPYARLWKPLTRESRTLFVIVAESEGGQTFGYDTYGRLVSHGRNGVAESWTWAGGDAQLPQDDFFNVPASYTEPNPGFGRTAQTFKINISQKGMSVFPDLPPSKQHKWEGPLILMDKELPDWGRDGKKIVAPRHEEPLWSNHMLTAFSKSGAPFAFAEWNRRVVAASGTAHYLPVGNGFKVSDGRPVSQTYPGRSETMQAVSYNALGDVTATEYMGIRAEYSGFDDLGRPGKVTYPGLPDLSYDVSYRYVGGTMRVSRSEASGNSVDAFLDERGLTVQQDTDMRGDSFSIRYAYDPLGRLSSVDDAAGGRTRSVSYVGQTAVPNHVIGADTELAFTVDASGFYPAYTGLTTTESVPPVAVPSVYKTDYLGRPLAGTRSGIGPVTYQVDEWGRTVRTFDASGGRVLAETLLPDNVNLTGEADYVAGVGQFVFHWDYLGLDGVTGTIGNLDSQSLSIYKTQIDTASPHTFTVTTATKGGVPREQKFNALGQLLEETAGGISRTASVVNGRGVPTAWTGDFAPAAGYDPTGKLTDFTTGQGHRFTNLTTSHGRPAGFTDPRGLALDVQYTNPVGGVVGTVMNGTDTLFKRNGADTERTSTLGATHTDTLSVAGTKATLSRKIPAQPNSPLATTTVNADALSGQIQSVTHPAGAGGNAPTSSFLYDGNGRLSGTQTVRGKTFDVTPSYISVATNGLSRSVWWGDTTVTPSGGTPVSYGVDAYGRLKYVDKGSKGGFQVTRNADGQVARYQDFSTGRTHQVTYDALTGFATGITGGHQPVRFSNHQHGLPSHTEVGPPGAPLLVRDVVYHAGHHGMPDTVTDTLPGGLKAETTYDVFGAVVGITKPYRAPVRYRYNTWGLPEEMSDDGGQTWKTLFGTRNNLTWNPHPNLTLAADAEGRLASVDMGGTEPLSYHYDGDGLLSRVSDPNGDRYAYTYDRGLLKTESWFDGAQLTYAYDNDDRLTEVSSFAGRLGQYTYTTDGTDRIETYTDPNGAEHTYTYTADGQLGGIDIANGPSFHYDYHADGRLAGVSTGGMSAEYGAYSHGRAGSIQWKLGGSAVASLTTTFTGDGAVDTISGNGFLLDLDWDLSTRPGSPMISRLEKRGPGYGEVWVPRYTADLKLDGVTVTRSNGDVIVENYDMSSLGLPGKLERKYNDDVVLDTALTKSGLSGGMRTAIRDNQNVIYDASGNLQFLVENENDGRNETYVFDGRRRLKSLQFKRRGGTTQNLTYEYDAADRRTRTSDTPTLEPRVYAWQGSRLIAIGNLVAGVIRWTHAIGQGPDGPAFIEDLVGDEDYFIFADHLGTPFAYKNAHTGTVYYAPTNPWGELWDHDAAAPAPFEEGNRPIPMVQDKDTEGNPVGAPHPLYTLPPFSGFTGPPLGLAGHLRDGRTGLIYMHHRSLHPRLGHFLNPDFRLPDIYDPTTYKEPYAYAAGNPLMFWDPNGLDPKISNPFSELIDLIVDFFAERKDPPTLYPSLEDEDKPRWDRHGRFAKEIMTYTTTELTRKSPLNQAGAGAALRVASTLAAAQNIIITGTVDNGSPNLSAPSDLPDAIFLNFVSREAREKLFSSGSAVGVVYEEINWINIVSMAEMDISLAGQEISHAITKSGPGHSVVDPSLNLSRKPILIRPNDRRFPNLKDDIYEDVPIFVLKKIGGKWRTISVAGNIRTARGNYIYVVMDGETRVIASNFRVAGREVSHIDIAKGVDVNYAGEITFGSGKNSKGVIRTWNNGSGHYQPPLEANHQTEFPLDLFEIFKRTY